MPEAPLPLQYRAMVHDRKGATMTTRTSTIAVLASLSLAAGCGSSSTGASGHSVAPHPSTASTRDATTGQTAGGSTTSDLQLASVTASQDMRAYLHALAAIRGDIARANASAHHEAQLAGAADFAAAAVESARVSRDLIHAAKLAARITPPADLEHAHARLVAALVIGSRMAHRLSRDFAHFGGPAAYDIKRQVLPLEKLTVRLANRWYAPTQRDLALTGVRQPRWIDGMFDWS
jgi:hypothetical protein